MHHLDGAAGEAESHGPQGALARPVGYLVKCCSRTSFIILIGCSKCGIIGSARLTRHIALPPLSSPDLARALLAAAFP